MKRIIVGIVLGSNFVVDNACNIAKIIGVSEEIKKEPAADNRRLKNVFLEAEPCVEPCVNSSPNRIPDRSDKSKNAAEIVKVDLFDIKL